MAIERLLQICVAAMVSLGALLVSTGYSLSMLPLVAAIGAFTSIVVTDMYGWVRLNHWAVNVSGLCAAGMSIATVRSIDSQSLLLAAAYLLIYLQLVLMFQRKTTRTYWQLLMSGLLCVVVAAALNEDMAFGFWLLVYVFCGLFTLAVFYIYRETSRSEGPPTTVPARRSRWPLSSTPSQLSSAPRGDFAESFLRAALVWKVFELTVGSACLATVAFYLLPRRAQEPTSAQASLGPSMVGFSRKVQLGGIGTAAENPQVVLSLELFDSDGKSLKLDAPPLIRGAVLSHYAGYGEWREQEELTRSSETTDLRRVSPGPGIVRENISLKQFDDDLVFAIYPAMIPAEASRAQADKIKYQDDSQHLVENSQRRSSSINYRLATTAIWNNRQYSIVGEENNAVSLWPPSLTKLPQDADAISGVVAAARRIVREAGVEDASIVEKARALEAHFLAPGAYRYSLSAAKRPIGVDPIEDFVTNQPVGHCEYFASALALMLRSQGIPARVVVGFRADEWNDLGNWYQVRQLHAHTWVEVYLHDNQIPPWPAGHAYERDPGSAPRAAWLILDPTPASGEDIAVSDGLTWYQRMRQWSDYVQRMWSQYVVGLTAERQLELFLPILNDLRLFIAVMFDASTWDDSSVNLRSFFRGNWFSWQGFVVAVIVCGFLVLAWRLAAMLLRPLMRRLGVGRRGEGSGLQARVGFYRSLEQLGARYGIVREPPQTAYEYSDRIAGFLEQRGHGANVRLRARRLADALCRVRFGEEVLSRDDQESLEADVQAIAAAFDAVARSRFPERRSA